MQDIEKGPLPHGVGLELQTGRIVVVAAFRDPTAARLFAEVCAELPTVDPRIKAAVLVPV